MIKPGGIVSHFEIIEKLGAGGMGLVFLAQDTRLDRRVALKVLPPHALASDDERTRFYREARAAAALNHPNIAHVYEIDEWEDEEGIGHPFIAMEYVDGETLANCISRGPLPLGDAVRIAMEVASGLHLAHEKGIVHRDIKTGNVMLTPAGLPKILDFGLAKTAASTKLTRLGSTLGTIAYMSPEQARGEEVDHRTDIWSLGAVLYEMITGRVPFPGDYEQAVVYAILNQDPEPLTAVRTGVPMTLEWIVSKCMAHDPDDRYQSAREIAVDLRTADLSGSGSTRVSSRKSVAPEAPLATQVDLGSRTSSARRVSLMVAAAVALATLLAGFLAAMLAFRQSDVPPPIVRHFNVQLPGHGTISHPSLSPDGRYLAFTSATVEGPGLWLYDVTTGRTSGIPETNDSRLSSFSPDSRWLVFERGDGLSTVLVPDGTPVEFVEAGALPTWMSAREVLFILWPDLYRKSLDGGPARLVASPQAESGESTINYPMVLPGHQWAVVTVEYLDGSRLPNLFLLDLESGDRSLLVEGASAAKYAPSGHLVYVQGGIDGQIMAQPIDLQTGGLTGPAVPVIGRTGFWTYDIGQDGSLVYTGAEGESGNLKSLFWLTGSGKVLDTLALAPDDYQLMEISPDGERLVVGIGGVQSFAQVDVYDFRTGIKDRLETYGFHPMWSPDGREVLLTVSSTGTKGLGSPSASVRRWIDRSRPDQIIDPDARWLAGVSGDGRYLALGVGGSQMNATADSDLILLDTQAGRSTPIDTSEWNHFTASFSPDSRFIAYDEWQGSWAGNNWRVVVRDLEAGGLVRVSPGLGFNPRWAPDGHNIYYQDVTTLYRVPVVTDSGFEMQGPPEPVQRIETGFLTFALHPDGKRVLTSGPIEGRRRDTKSSLKIVLNWSEELRRLAPAAK